MSNDKVQNPNDKGTPTRSLLAVIGPVFAFRGLPSAVLGPNDHGHETRSRESMSNVNGQQAP